MHSLNFLSVSDKSMNTLNCVNLHIFVIVCKPLLAHGSTYAHQVELSHQHIFIQSLILFSQYMINITLLFCILSTIFQMSLIFSESGLKTISPPCVAQTFINHNARLFKLFLIKDKYYVIERPSLKNFKAGSMTLTIVSFIPIFFLIIS